jgi:hypothetical protein
MGDELMDEAQPIDIDAFVREEVLRLHLFVKMWQAGVRTAPDDWPEKMPLGEWDEQYRSFEPE